MHEIAENDHFCAAIRRARLEQKLSIQDVSGRVGCAVGLLSEVETGKRRCPLPPSKFIEGLSDALGLYYEELEALARRYNLKFDPYPTNEMYQADPELTERFLRQFHHVSPQVQREVLLQMTALLGRYVTV